MLGILYPYVLHSADKVNYILKHSRPAPLPWLWEGGMGEEGLEVYRSKAWSTSVRSRSVERRKGQRKGSLSLSQSIKREILLRLLRGISVICLFNCPTTLLCCLSQYSLLVMAHWGSMLCFWCVPVIHGTVHLFSSPLNMPSQWGVRLYPQARTPAPSDLQLPCSSSNLKLFAIVLNCSNLKLFAIVLNCLLLLRAHLHFLYRVSQKSLKVVFVILFLHWSFKVCG